MDSINIHSESSLLSSGLLN